MLTSHVAWASDFCLSLRCFLLETAGVPPHGVAVRIKCEKQ